MFSSIHCHAAGRDKLEILIRGDRLHMGVSEKSAPPQKKNQLIVHIFCATKDCMILMPAVSLVLVHCAQFTWSDAQPLYNGYRVFPGGRKRQRRDADSTPTSSAVV